MRDSTLASSESESAGFKAGGLPVHFFDGWPKSCPDLGVLQPGHSDFAFLDMIDDESTEVGQRRGMISSLMVAVSNADDCCCSN